MNKIYEILRQALNVTGDGSERLSRVNKRLSDHPRNLIPECAGQPHNELVAAFIDHLEAVEASIALVDDMPDVVNEIARYMIVNDLPPVIRCGSDQFFSGVDWSAQPDLQVLSGAARSDDVLSLTHAFAGAAETGTLFVASGPGNPVTLSFLPRINIVLIRGRDIVGPYEDGWLKLPWISGAPLMPRTINMISGPSRTADIEQTLITGAHGPCKLHVIVVG